MRKLVTSLSFGLFIVFGSRSALAKASIAIVTSKENHIKTLSLDQVKDLFLGGDKFLPNGERSVIVDQIKTTDIKAEFYKALNGMSLKDVTRHWAKVTFTGRGLPPEQVSGGDPSVKAWIKSNPNSIGYIYADSVDESVKVLFTLPP